MFVVITHFSWSDEERLQLLFPVWIDMAVPIFMIISGYVYALSYNKHNISNMGEAYLPKNIINKLIRHTIPFTLIFILEQIIYLVLKKAPFDWGTFCLSFLRGGEGPGSYYYPVMMQFVFLFPMIYFIVKKYDFKGVIICGFINVAYEILQRAYMVSENCYRLLVFRYILLIAVGCYMTSGMFKIRKGLSIICCLIGFGFIYAVQYMGYQPQILIYWTARSFLACLWIISIVIILITKLQNLRIRLLEVLGKASYNIFLVQMLYYNGREIEKKLIPNRCELFVIGIIACLMLGVIFYYIETPITKKIIKGAEHVLRLDGTKKNNLRVEQ